MRGCLDDRLPKETARFVIVGVSGMYAFKRNIAIKMWGEKGNKAHRVILISKGWLDGSFIAIKTRAAVFGGVNNFV